MGANKNSDRRKCGDILISIKSIKNKAKIFTFHCSLCSLDCDQLKKFSKHLESHLHYFENDLENSDENAMNPVLLFEPEEIKVEDIELIDKISCNVGSATMNSKEYNDPLETENISKIILKRTSDSERKIPSAIKTEHKIEEQCKDVGSKISCDSRATDLESAEIERFKTDMNHPCPLILNNSSSDDFSDYSSDLDMDEEKELQTTKYMKMFRDIKSSTISEKKKKCSNKNNEHNPIKGINNNKPKRRRRVIIDKILPILIQQYKKYKLLWQVDDIAYGVKSKKYEIYGKIAEVLKLEADEIVSLEDINYHINYLNELYSKDKEHEMQCKTEGKEFLPEFEYYNEMSFLSSSQGPFLCESCDEILPKYHAYCQHVAEHNDTLPFKCSSCEMMFTNYHKYLIHKKRHLGIHDYHCHICGKGYLFKNDLEWHVTSHTGDKPYLCPICGTGFRARHGYDNHIRRHEERFRYECHLCKKGFNQLHALNNHVKSHLNIRDVICKICGKGFVHSKYLKRHELIHGKEKRYKCNECGKAFFQACGLRAHRKNHHS